MGYFKPKFYKIHCITLNYITLQYINHWINHWISLFIQACKFSQKFRNSMPGTWIEQQQGWTECITVKQRGSPPQKGAVPHSKPNYGGLRAQRIFMLQEPPGVNILRFGDPFWMAAETLPIHISPNRIDTESKLPWIWHKKYRWYWWKAKHLIYSLIRWLQLQSR